ncbi:MAG: nucleotidyltransferase domain-containing protein, partial [Nanoarchaeota archaeon]
MNFKLISYAMDCISHSLQFLREDAEHIKEIILFGSVSRGEDGKESDIDLFFNTKKEMEQKIISAKEKFLTSQRAEKWKLLNIKNEINIQSGDLDEEEGLKESIISNGIVLFGRYSPKEEKERATLFTIHVKEKASENLKLWRKIYGYKQKVGKKTYQIKGLLEQYAG